MPGDTVEAVPKFLLDRVPDGRYAVPGRGSDTLVFLRVSRPKRGSYKDTIKIQEQIAETLKTVYTVWPSGKISRYVHWIDGSLISLVANYKFAAALYGQEIEQCCRCGVTLTDERSRKYGIGPECEKHWPWVIEEVDERDELKKDSADE